MAKNVRNMIVDAGKAVDVKNTSQLTPDAHEDAGWTAKNETKEHVPANPKVGGPGGGENAGL